MFWNKSIKEHIHKDINLEIEQIKASIEGLKNIVHGFDNRLDILETKNRSLRALYNKHILDEGEQNENGEEGTTSPSSSVSKKKDFYSPRPLGL